MPAALQQTAGIEPARQPSQVIERAHVQATGHRAKALLHILDTFPRDELFQCSIPDLSRTAIGVLNLQDRQRVRFFLRRDTFRRFFSCLVFVPRERYTTAVRRRIETVLKEELDKPEPSVVITKDPCVLQYRVKGDPMHVDAEACTGCRQCLKVGCIALSMEGEGDERHAAIDPNFCTGCTVCAQVCKFDAIQAG